MTATFVMATVLGLLFAFGTFLVLRRDLVRVVWGVIIMSQATNAYLVTMGGFGGSVPVLGGHGGHGAAGTVQDPLVQALVLTAIVIGFGTTAFALVLSYRVYEEHGTIDLEELGNAMDPSVGDAGESAATTTDGGEPFSAPSSTSDASDGGGRSSGSRPPSNSFDGGEP